MVLLAHTALEYMAESNQQVSSSSIVVSVWEGEWPALKTAVGSVRRFSGTTFDHTSEYFDFHTYRAAALETVAKADATAVQQSKRIGVAYRENPWAIPAAGISAVSMFVYSKSIRWGVPIAMRNGAATATLLTVAVFPHEVRQVFTELVTTKPL